MTSVCRALAVFAATFGLMAQAGADTFPSRPIRLIVPFPAGGPTDMLARILAKGVGESMGQTVVVENRGGAGGTLGVESVARAAPDGYTLLMGSTSTLAVSPYVYKVSYDIQRDFSPISLFASSPLTLVVNAKSGIHTVGELVAHAASHRGKTFYGSPGAGTQSQLTSEMFMEKAKVEATHVPYKGGGPALAGLLGGEVDFMFDIIQTSIPLAKSGRATVLGVASKQRSPKLPDVPTVAEAGLPGFEATSWLGILAPAGTPVSVVERIDAAIKAFVSLPQTVAQFSELGTDPSYLSHGDFASLITKEVGVWGRLAQATQSSNP